MPRAPREQQLLRHAKREGLLLMAVWALALAWSVGYSRFFGYSDKVEDVGLIFGVPEWVIWGIAVPWLVCFLFTVWFCFFFMADDDLGKDPEETSEHV
jgi:hypothetical protein